MRAQAAVLYRTGAPLVIEELEVPGLLEGQVLVEVAFAGLCGSQLLEVRGKKGPDRHLPHALGHEGSGKVVGLGPGVTQVALGDRVVISWIPGLGLEGKPAKYLNHRGEIVNAGPSACFISHAVVSENRCTPIVPEADLKWAALLGCAVPTGAGIVFNELGAKAGESVLVFGAGGVGLSAILAAAQVGCHPIVAVDLSFEKLAFAKELGATHVIDARGGNAALEIERLIPGGAKYAIDASGSPRAMELGFKSVARGGGHMVIAGNPPSGDLIAIEPMELIRGRRISGSVGGSTRPERDIPRYLSLRDSGRFAFERLATRVYGLGEINRALDELEQGSVGRSMITFLK